MAIFVIKVTTNKEDKAMDMIIDRVTKKTLQVQSVFRPHGLRGYLFLEATDRESAEESAYDLQYVKGIIGKTVTYDEVKNMLEPSVAEMKIEKNDIVEILAEPFKKEKAKVIRVDKQKEEVVVTLLEAAIPIPVTVKLDNVKVIRRESDKEDSDEESQESSEEENSDLNID